HDADEGPGNKTVAAGQQRSADHDGADRVQLYAHGRQRIARRGVEREDDAGEAGKRGRERIDEDRRARDRHTHERRRDRIAAERIDV
ncbi:hypothetical protein COLO4_02489, partial [Corchorus olitorius]